MSRNVTFNYHRQVTCYVFVNPSIFTFHLSKRVSAFEPQSDVDFEAAAAAFSVRTVLLNQRDQALKTF